MPSARAEAARQLRAILDAVARGEMDATSTHEKALLRRIEGVVVGLEAKPSRPPRSS